MKYWREKEKGGSNLFKSNVIDPLALKFLASEKRDGLDKCGWSWITWQHELSYLLPISTFKKVSLGQTFSTMYMSMIFYIVIQQPLACRLFIKSFWVFLWKLILYACVIQDLFDCKWQNSSWFKKEVSVLEGYSFILYDLNSGQGDTWLDLRENRIWTFKCPQNSCSLQLSAVFLSACWFCPQPL